MKNSKKILLLLFFLFTFFSTSFLLMAQHLYYTDGSKFPLSISNNYVTVKFQRGIPIKQQNSYLTNLPEIDTGKEKWRLPNGFSGLPLNTNVLVNQFIQKLKSSDFFTAVFPVYVGSDSQQHLMYDEFLVRFKPWVTNEEIEAFCARHEVEIVKIKDVEPTQYTFRWTPEADGNPLIIANMFFDSLDCEWATPDFTVQGEFFYDPPTDTYFQNQYYLHNTGQEPIPGEGAGVVDADIDALEAWDISLGNSDITVAVIDEGVEAHEDLQSSRILPGYDFIGFNYHNPSSDSDPSPDGNEAHGMACAGIIAASHNGTGVAGIAPNCKILPVKIGDYRGYLPEQPSRVADAVDYAWHNGQADVINGSWGYYYKYEELPKYLYPIRDAVNRAMNQGREGLGTVCVFAAGNNGD